MKTEELVSLLAAGPLDVPGAAPARRTALAAAAGTAAAVLFTAAVLGLQPALADYVFVPMFWVREGFCAVLGVAGLLAVARLSRPGTGLGLVPLGVLIPLLTMWILGGAALLAAGKADRAPLILGLTASVCPFLIALVSVPLFVAFHWTMRGLAPTRLRLAGAAAGFAAGAVAALVYTLHCPELAAPFLGIWYVLGMLIPAAAGAALGPRLLRW